MTFSPFLTKIKPEQQNKKLPRWSALPLFAPLQFYLPFHQLRKAVFTSTISCTCSCFSYTVYRILSRLSTKTREKNPAIFSSGSKRLLFEKHSATKATASLQKKLRPPPPREKPQRNSRLVPKMTQNLISFAENAAHRRCAAFCRLP